MKRVLTCGLQDTHTHAHTHMPSRSAAGPTPAAAPSEGPLSLPSTTLPWGPQPVFIAWGAETGGEGRIRDSYRLHHLWAGYQGDTWLLRGAQWEGGVCKGPGAGGRWCGGRAGGEARRQAVAASSAPAGIWTRPRERKPRRVTPRPWFQPAWPRWLAHLSLLLPFSVSGRPHLGSSSSAPYSASRLSPASQTQSDLCQLPH